jgi:methylmalonyl-CoA mutase cobalamin-binding subunit
VVALPPGAHHQLAALAFATAARRAGMRVAYLGADVPVDSWVTAVQETRAQAAVVGAVMLRDADAAEQVVRALASRAPDVLRVIGGRYADAVPGADHLVLPVNLEEAVAALRASLLPSA